ncbi:anthranilate synthase family protein [Amycolatopsis sp. NPDC049688]|uniref:anthranilate synthase family protein n=1 Tax=Amycolatopsis sp. NPDC049688 TaxID=3154733 RepID=UPI003417C039
MDKSTVNHLLQQNAPFALLHRPAVGGGEVEFLSGEVAEFRSLQDLPSGGRRSRAGHETLAMIPFRQITERGFACVDDGAPLLAMRVREQGRMSLEAVARWLPDEPLTVTGGRFDLTDDEYADLVRTVLHQEIGTGQGANFVVRRTYTATIAGFSARKALAIFRRLLTHEFGAYWTFLFHTGSRTFVGATPERHVSVDGGTMTMSPISGTYRYPPTGPTISGLLGFLADEKEIDELSMVVDEELKMMTRLCVDGARVSGPYLREMARVAHTEYRLRGRTTGDLRHILRETMFAPTVTGSPLENACQVLSRHERTGRGYYSGVVALLGTDTAGRPVLDSSIVIRTAEIAPTGRFRIGVGATLVRHSCPRSEAAETRAKAAGLLHAMMTGGREAPGPGPAGLAELSPAVHQALGARTPDLAPFWLDPAGGRRTGDLAGRTAVVVDAEDTFTAMLAHQLRTLGLAVTTRPYDDVGDTDGFDLVVVGPGPGDPRHLHQRRQAALRAITERLLDSGRPFVSICLGHQILCGVLGFPVVPKRPPAQGRRIGIDLFGRHTMAGFYNTFVALVDHVPAVPVSVCADAATGEIHALRGERFRSTQFHPESVLTTDGVDILADMVAPLLHATTARGATR